MTTVDGAAALGIDFGTSNTVAVLAWPGQPPAPLLFDGSPLLPSAVYAAEDRLLAGRVALRSAAMDPARCEPNPKRCIDDGAILLGDREYAVTDVFAAVLNRVALEARRVIGGNPERVVLTHPAGWGARRLRTLRMAAEAADLPTPDFLPEPVAAAGHFAEVRAGRIPDGASALIYDLGGGTCDVTLVRRIGESIEVVATEGIADVGGTYVDAAIVEHLSRTHPGDGDEWVRLRAPQNKVDRRHRRMLWDDVREAKEALSETSRVEMFLPLLDTDIHFTREELDRLSLSLIQDTVALAARVLARSKGATGLFLVGGGSRMPLAATELHRATGIAPLVVEQPELVVAIGAVRASGLAIAGPVTVTVPVPEAAPTPTETVAPVPDTTPTAPREVPAPRAPEPSASSTPSTTDTRSRLPAYDGISAIRVRPDGTAWAVATPNAIHLWIPANGTGSVHLPGDWEGVWHDALAWSPDGLLLAGADVNGVVRVFVAATGEALPDPEHGDSVDVEAVAWSPDGRYLAAGSRFGQIDIWDPVNLVDSLTFREAAIRRLAWSPGASTLAIVGDGVGLMLHDIETGADRNIHDVADVAWTHDGLLVELTRKSVLRVRDLRSNFADAETGLRGWDIVDLCCSPTHRRIAALATGEQDGTGIWLYDLAVGSGGWWPVPGIGLNASLSWMPDGRHLLLVDLNAGRPHIWDATTGREVSGRVRR